MGELIEMPSGLPRPVVLVPHRGAVRFGRSSEGRTAYLVAERVREQP